ncbi:MAG TPA: BTAD domain-containing putative transcriptional regulator [Actinocrinis sp.]|nr:BTAD domain-containing putative transcriptional regulator [Actinocrinis sp.]
MEFRMLGALEILSEGRPLAPGGRREKAVLAALLLEADHIVPITRLVDAVWECDPPATAAKQVRNAVARLRGLCWSAGMDGNRLIATVGLGYRFEPPEGALDARRFEAEVAAADKAAAGGDPAAAVRHLDRALDLWRGPALAGLSGRVIESAAAAWNERRLAVRLSRVELRLALHRHAEVLPELVALIGEHPLLEKPVGQLMLALYRCGRDAEALNAYDALRTRLREELGLDPRPELRRLRQQILTRADIGAEPAEPGLGAPRKLPAPVYYFAGRAEQIRVLDGLLDDPAEPVAALVISAIDGTAGIGKTALAVHWAHRVADRFPDGQLYVNLRGFDPSGMPMTPAEAARGFLEAFGVARESIPLGDEAQLAMYHRILAGRRALVLLDNARDAEQVRPLFPAAPSSVVVVTSRRRLTGLAVADGARPITLGLLTDAEARDLLERRLGPARVAAQCAAVDQIIASCARLPLALSIAAAHAAARDGLPLADIAAQLEDTHSLLDVLDTGDPATQVRAVFSWSCRHLEPAAARLFRLLGVAPGPDISVPAAAALAQASVAEASRALGELTRASLLSERVAGRYAFHDLLRAYAAEQCREQDSETVRRAAVRRLLDYYLHSAYAAERLLHPARDPIALPPAPAGLIPLVARDGGHARAWFEAEHANLLAAVRTATRDGYPAHVWRFAWSLSTYLQRGGHWSDWESTQLLGLNAAATIGDYTGEICAHRALGRLRARFGTFEDADGHLKLALDLAVLHGDRLGRARVHVDRAWMAELAGRNGEALAEARQALALLRELGHRHGMGETLNAVGWYLAMVGEFRSALEHCEEALELLRGLGHDYGMAGTWDSLGYIHHNLGEGERAVECYREAVRIFHRLGDRSYEAGSVVRLGDAFEATGDLDAARESWRTALATLEELDHPDAAQVRAKLVAAVSAQHPGRPQGDEPDGA